MPPQQLSLDDVQEGLLALLRTKGLSIKELDDKRREELREFLDYLHNTKGMSLNDVAKLIGNKTSGYTSWVCRQLGVKRRPFEEARLKGIKEKRRKYERKPFDGTDEDKAYLLGLRHGDLSVSKPWNGVVRVSTSTTHPAMAKLFRALFEPYGHVYQHPRYKKDTETYEWNLSTILDSSFDFLLQSIEQSKKWIEETESRLLAYFSGLLDAEGSIVVTRDNRGKVTIFVDYNNTNRPLLEWLESHIKRWGYYCCIRLNKESGVRSKKYGITHRSDYWQFSSYGMDNIQTLIVKLQPRHLEKVMRKRIALTVRKGQDFESVRTAMESLRARIRKEVQDFVLQAESEYKAKHGGS